MTRLAHAVPHEMAHRGRNEASIELNKKRDCGEGRLQDRATDPVLESVRVWEFWNQR